MTTSQTIYRLRALCLAAVAVVASGGCTAFLEPREPYPITPPEPSPNSTRAARIGHGVAAAVHDRAARYSDDQAVKIVPKPPHTLEPFDGLLIRVANAFADQPIADAFVDRSGRQGRPGSVVRPRESGGPDDRRSQARNSPAMAQLIEDPEVSVSLAFSSGAQQISGEHLVGPGRPRQSGHVRFGVRRRA